MENELWCTSDDKIYSIVLFYFEHRISMVSAKIFYWKIDISGFL